MWEYYIFGIFGNSRGLSARLQPQHPKAFVAILADFNHANLGLWLCFTKEEQDIRLTVCKCD